jgi:hypothetical protein
MDAATLYVMLTMQDGTQTTSARGYPSLRACAAGMEFMKEVARTDRQGPIIGFWCVEPKPLIRIEICESQYSGRCDRYTPSTRRGCEALRWITHMRDRRQFGRCYQDPPDPPEKGPPPRSE